MSGTVQVPAGLDAGTATLQLTGSASQFTASNTFTVAAAAPTPTPDPDQTSPAGAVSATSTATPPTELAASGTNSTGYLVGAALALVLGAVILITRSHTRRTS